MRAFLTAGSVEAVSAGPGKAVDSPLLVDIFGLIIPDAERSEADT